jgi:hypothetical protein
MPAMYATKVFGTVLLVGLCAAARAQELPAYRTNNIAAMRELFNEELVLFAGNTNVLVLPGVRADREARRVVVQAEATGIAESDIAEFFIIAPHSGNDYEALLISLATAGDIDRGLQFIGLAPGRCVDYARYQFWPKGERVRVRVQKAGDSASLRPIESLVLDEATGDALPHDGLVYVQAPGDWVAASDSPERHPIDADSRGAIAANYNEPYTLLDVPRIAPQSDVYSRHTVNSNDGFSTGERIEIIMKPELPAGAWRIQDMDLAITASCATQSLANLQFTLTNRTAGTSLPTAGMNDLLHHFSMLCQNKKDPFVTLHIDDAVQIDALKAFCLILASIETNHGIRMEPPAGGHLYYKAYMPDNALRDRGQRIMQPAELTFRRTGDGTIAVSLLEITEHWHDEVVKPTLTFKTHPIASPAALRDQLADDADNLPILLVFVPPTLTHGELMQWMAPVLGTHPTVHVFTAATGH